MTESATVVRLAARGDGVTDDGRFVQGVAPGDRVRFGEEGMTIEPGPHHAVPPCRHFPECGGCQLQHVDEAAYSEWVAARIVHAVESAGVKIGTVESVHLSPPNSRRRASLRAVRQGQQAVVGFNAERSHRLIDMHECHILLPELFVLVAPLRALLAEVGPEGQAAGIMLTATETGVDLLLSNIDARSARVAERLARFAADTGLARLSVETAAGVDVVAETRAPVVRFDDVPVVLPPAPFLQATPDGEAALQNAVLAVLGKASRVADLFCGLGTFALPASRRAKVVAADAAGPAVRALEGAARQGGRAVAVEHRDLFRRPLNREELKRFDAVIIDPPRAGAKEQVEQLALSRVPRIAAVSCNPNTFARDAAILARSGYRLERLWPVGQFRWSTHVELVAGFVR